MSRAIRPHERGSALVIAILVLFAMLGLGMLAMRSTTQNIAGTGNLRMEKQARYVAEDGLYHAVTLLNSGAGQQVLGLYQGIVNPNKAALEIDSNGTVRVLDRSDPPAVLAVDNTWAPAPAVLGAARAPLGAAGGALTASYRVRVEGFTLGKQGSDPSQVFCLMHLTATGYIAPMDMAAVADPTAQIDAAAQAGNLVQFAEQQMKAAVQVNELPKTLCKS